MEGRDKNKVTKDSCKTSCKTLCMTPQVTTEDPCKESYNITQEDIRTMRKLAHQLGKLNENIKEFRDMASGGGFFSSLFK